MWQACPEKTVSAPCGLSVMTSLPHPGKAHLPPETAIKIFSSLSGMSLTGLKARQFVANPLSEGNAQHSQECSP
jgi:hypothetical protein